MIEHLGVNALLDVSNKGIYSKNPSEFGRPSLFPYVDDIRSTKMKDFLFWKHNNDKHYLYIVYQCSKYKDMKLKDLFDKYEEESYAEIQEELKKVTSIPHDVFALFWNKIYKRSK